MPQVDIAQTDGPELPTVDVPTVDTAADDLLAGLIRVSEHRSVTVKLQPIESGAFGVSKRGAVDVDNRHATGQQAKTLAHELAHEALHWEDRGPFTRSVAELEAESVAYVVCKYAGLDVEVRSSRYIALSDGDSKALRSSLERIADTARSIIDDLESVQAGKAVAPHPSIISTRLNANCTRVFASALLGLRKLPRVDAQCEAGRPL